MALTDLQRRIMRRLSLNRSETSYLAGGTILNLNWPRRSDDINIFHACAYSIRIANIPGKDLDPVKVLFRKSVEPAP